MTRYFLALLLPLLALPQEAPPEKPKPTPRLDLYGDPLPEGAVARCGTVRFRHEDCVLSLVFSPGGETLAAGDLGGEIRFWDVKTRRERRRMQTDSTQALRFLSNGELLVGAGDCGVEFWKMPPGERSRVLSVPEPDFECWNFPFNSLDLSSDQGILAFGSRVTGSLHAWDLSTGKDLLGAKWPQMIEKVALALSPDGKTLAAGGEGLGLWRLPSGEALQCGKPADVPIICLRFSPGGKEIIAGCPDGLVRVFDATGTEQVREIRMHESPIRDLQLSPDGGLLATTGTDRVLCVWDFEKGAATFRSGGRTFPYTVRTLNTATAKWAPGALAFSGDGETIAAADGHGIVLWDRSSKEMRADPSGHWGAVASLLYSPDGRRIVSGSYDGTVRLWDATSGEEQLRLRAHPDVCSIVRFSPDGRVVASLGGDGALRLWSASTGKAILALTGRRGSRHPFAFSCGGEELVVLETGGKVITWDAATGSRRRTYQVPTTGFREIRALSPDGRLLACSEKDPDERRWYVALHDTKKARRLVRLEHPKGHVVHGFAFSPDGSYLVSGTSLGEARLWEVATGRCALKMDLRAGSNPGYAFSPDGAILCAFGFIHTTFCDLASGKLLSGFPEQPFGVTAVAFDPGGRTYATGFRDTTILIRPLPQEDPSRGASPDHPRSGSFPELWNFLSGLDAEQAYKSIWKMASMKNDAVEEVRRHLEKGTARPSADVDQLISQLDSSDYETRESALQELVALGVAVEQDLRSAVGRGLSPEARVRAGALLEQLESPYIGRPCEELRRLRSIQVLERIGTDEAREVLRDLVKDSPSVREQAQAQAALARLEARGNE